MKMKSEKGKLRILWLLLVMISGALAASQISDDFGCGSCSTLGNDVCRADYYDRYAYCCDATEVGSRSCGGPTAFCQSNSLNPTIETFACPYSAGFCGASSSDLVMHPTTRNSLKIEISNRLFVDTTSCYYVFSVPTDVLDLVDTRYFWDVEFYERTNVIIQLNNGTSLFTANDPITVSTAAGNRY